MKNSERLRKMSAYELLARLGDKQVFCIISCIEGKSIECCGADCAECLDNWLNREETEGNPFYSSSSWKSIYQRMKDTVLKPKIKGDYHA